MLAAQAQAARDVLIRQAEQEQEVVMHMLRERGYHSRDARIEHELFVDNRQLGALSPVKAKLEYSEGFIAHREQYAAQRNSKSDYLRLGPAELALQKSRSKLPQSEVIRNPKEELHERLQLLINDVHVERAGRVWQASRSMNTLGVFPPSVNALRATSLCHAEALIRPSCSVEQLRATAEEQLATGYERPPPTTSASGEPIEPTGPERLRGKLDKLEERIQRSRLGAEAPLSMRERSMSTRSGAGGVSSRRLPASRAATVRAGCVATPAAAPSWNDEPPAAAEALVAEAAFPESAAGHPGSLPAGLRPHGRPMRVSQSMPALVKG